MCALLQYLLYFLSFTALPPWAMRSLADPNGMCALLLFHHGPEVRWRVLMVYVNILILAVLFTQE